MATAQDILNKAESYVGVKESPANSNNVIFNTHYYGQPVSGSDYPWCCVFIWDIFRLCGASSLFYGGKKCAYTPTLANYYKQQGRWYTAPKVGDIVFYQFKNSNRICHVGLVKKVVNSNKIITIEGNTSSTNDSNGGAVEIRERDLTYVKGFGRPAYDGSSSSASSGPGATTTDTNYTYKQFVKDVQKALGVNIDGIVGNQTFNATKTISKKINHTHAVVAPVQRYLNSLGYNCGTVDGDFGPATEAGVKAYQKQFMRNPDGEITAKKLTWRYLLNFR